MEGDHDKHGSCDNNNTGNLIEFSKFSNQS